MANLLSLDDYKVLKGITSTVNDDKLEAILTSVSQLARTYCGQQFDTYAGSPGKTEIFDIQWDTYVVQLHESPVIQIQAVYERSNPSEAYTQLLNDGTDSKYEWYFDETTDAVFRTNEAGGYKNWLHGVGAVKVIYTAGYLSTPEDLKLALTDLVNYYDKAEYKQMLTIGSTTQQGAGPSAVRNDPGFPDHIRRVLDLYRNV